jgi:hypothetical protein
MTEVKLDRDYYALTDVAYRWLQQNAPSTTWEQIFGYTTLNFEHAETATKFKKYMERKLNEIRNQN